VSSDGPKESCIGWGADLPTGSGNFQGKGWPIVKYRDALPWAVQKRPNQSRCHLGYGLWWAIDEAQIPHVEGAIIRGKACLGMPNNTLAWAVQKWLNQSICRLWHGLGWAKGSTSSIVFTMWCRRHLANTTEPSICGGNVALSNYFDHLLLLGRITAPDRCGLLLQME